VVLVDGPRGTYEDGEGFDVLFFVAVEFEAILQAGVLLNAGC